MKKIISMMLALTTVFITLFSINSVAYAGETFDYLDTLTPVQSDRYTGNMGDSCISKIKKSNNESGKKDIYGNYYEHGLEAWVARWNYEDEISWVYNVYNLAGKYNKLEGKIVLFDSYNTNNFNTSLYFYGDGELIKKYNMTPSTIPFKFSINVSGVKKLKILLKDNTAVSGGTLFGLTGLKLYKPYLILSESEIALNVGESRVVEYALKGASDSQKEQLPSWSSNKTSVAKVSSKGKIVAMGTGTCSITCKVGDAKKTLRVIVRPKKVTNLTVSSKSTNSVTIKWNRLKNVAGYKIYKYDNDIKEYVYLKTVDGEFRSTTIKKLKRGKTYRFKIRAYIKVNNKTYYGNYSEVLKVTTKK